MSRYIDAEKIPYTDLNSDMPQSKVRVWVAFKERIDRIPTAVVVEIVRCKDCVNCTHLNDEWWCGVDEVFPDGFCNYGERRTDEEPT